MGDLRDLYQDVILEHSKAPRNFRELATANHKAEGFNPLCGDRFTVYLDLEGDSIRDISFQGSGCAISKASASMMTQSAKANPRRRPKRFSDASTKWSRAYARRPARSWQAHGVLRRVGISGAREMRDAGLAHTTSGARRQTGSDLNRIGEKPCPSRTNPSR